jgi:hypothetical protein
MDSVTRLNELASLLNARQEDGCLLVTAENLTAAACSL